jgi:preprotein translocase subunit SecG
LAHNTGAPLRNEVVFNKVVMKMSVIRLIMTIAIIAVSIVMTIVILMQEGRSQGLGAISGAAETYWGKNKGRSMEGFLEKFTTGLVIAFFVLAILLNMQLF